MIKVNGERIPNRLLRHELELLKSRYTSHGQKPPDESKLKDDARENAIEKMLLIQEARKRFKTADAAEVDRRYKQLLSKFGGRAKFQEKTGYKDKDTSWIKSELGDQIRYENLIDELSRDANVNENEAKDFYEKNIADFTVPEMVRASHILMRPDASKNEMEILCELRNLRDRVLNGEDFNVLASQSSHCRDSNGDLGYFARGQMVQNFEDKAFSMQVNEVSEPFITEFGIHIVKVFDKKPAHARDFEEVRQEIQQALIDMRKNKMIGDFVDKLRASARIETGKEDKDAPGEKPK